jgi:cytochrome c-type biogenesis protein CcmH
VTGLRDRRRLLANVARVAAWTAVAWLAALAHVASAQSVAQDPLDARLRQLESGLRCLVCQNQTLADSDAPLALDLRREIRELAVAGRSDDEIRAFLVARYGDFVLYRPPLKPVTWLLWMGPFALLLLGAAVWWGVLRRRAGTGPSAASTPSHDAEQRARDLLVGSDDSTPR